MTVKELIERLLDCPGEALVYVSVLPVSADGSGQLTDIEVQSAGAMVMLSHDSD